MNEQELIIDALGNPFGLEAPVVVSEASVLAAIEAALSRLLQAGGEPFFQLMYRMDIPEHRLAEVLEDRENGVARLARLIYERQLEKIRSRSRHRGSGTDEEELRW